MNENIEAADTLLKEVHEEIGRRHLLDIKYKTFVGIKEKLYSVVSLLNADPVKKDLVIRDYSDDLFDFFNTNYPQWQNKSRECTSLIPRQVLQYFLATQTSFNLKKIGALTGSKDHTTIIYSREHVSDMIETQNQAYVKVYNKVIDFLNSKKS